MFKRHGVGLSGIKNDWKLGNIEHVCCYMPEMSHVHVCSYVGRSFVKASGRPMEILERLNEMAGFAPNEEIQLYEVLVH